MAVAPTGAIYKSLYFDGEDSRDYGVYITGEAVYNAPEREVEMIAIPGRNGALALDKGRFENIEVTYPAGIYADTEEDFAEAISNFRNLLCSRRGYVRLQDEYNPNEYRMAIYKSGLEVEPTMLKAGEFEIVFDCKPQRWLTDGETAVTVDSGDVISNPTLFEASPLLAVEGYGDISFNGHNIKILNETYGKLPAFKTATLLEATYTFDGEFSNGDSIDFDECQIIYRLRRDQNNPKAQSLVTENPQTTGIVNYSSIMLNTHNVIRAGAYSFTVGTPATLTGTGSTEGWYGGASIGTFTSTMTIDYDGQNTIVVSLGITYSTDELKEVFLYDGMPYETTSALTNLKGISTASILGNPTYIDCDLGEAYKIENDEYISLNRYIDLGSDLPTLAPGANAVEIDNTITDLKVVPRWWIV